MHDRRRRAGRIRAIGIAVGVAVGLLLMHGLDARAVGEGHGLEASPRATLAAIAAARSPREGIVADTVAPTRSMAGHCIAVVAAAAALLLLVRAALRGRVDDHVAPTQHDGVTDQRTPWSHHGRCPPTPPRIALCVFLC